MDKVLKSKFCPVYCVVVENEILKVIRGVNKEALRTGSLYRCKQYIQDMQVEILMSLLDKAIPNDGNEIHLKEDEHFYSTKEFKIIVNGRLKEVTSKELSFTEIVSLAFSNPPTGENILFTVTYEKGEGSKPEGTLVQGRMALRKAETQVL